MKLGQLMANSGYLTKISLVILNILSFADRFKHEKSMNFSSKHATGHTEDYHLFPVHFLMLSGQSENSTFITFAPRLTSFCELELPLPVPFKKEKNE